MSMKGMLILRKGMKSFTNIETIQPPKIAPAYPAAMPIPDTNPIDFFGAMEESMEL